MKTETPLPSCLRNSLDAFYKGDTDLALKSIAITLAHRSNKHLHAEHIRKMLLFMAHYCVFEKRYRKAAAILERLVRMQNELSAFPSQNLACAYYELAECYGRMQDWYRCRLHFQKCLDQLLRTVGREHKSFKLINSRLKELEQRFETNHPDASERLMQQPLVPPMPFARQLQAV